MNKTAVEIDKPRLLRANDVAKILNISLALAYRLLQMGEIPCVRIGTAVRVRPEDLDAYIDANLTRNF
jgi:excisionase family DNA binding protein